MLTLLITSLVGAQINKNMSQSIHQFSVEDISGKHLRSSFSKRKKSNGS